MYAGHTQRLRAGKGMAAPGCPEAAALQTWQRSTARAAHTQSRPARAKMGGSITAPYCPGRHSHKTPGPSLG
eukprot:364209-Chlamydomonas_euryale.AAC.12